MSSLSRLSSHAGRVACLAALAAATLPLCLAARAETPVRHELAGRPTDQRFIVTVPTADGECAAGQWHAGGTFGPWCGLSIDECLAMPGTMIKQTPKGSWGCYRATSQ